MSNDIEEGQKSIKEIVDSELVSQYEEDATGKVTSNVHVDKEYISDKYDVDSDLLPDDMLDLNFQIPDIEKLSKIDITEFTKNVYMDSTTFDVTGDGMFDDLMETASTHLIAQFEAGRIHGEEYATAYVDIYKATLQILTNAWVAKAQAAAQAVQALSQAHLAKAQALKAYIEAKYAIPMAKAQLYLVQAQGEAQKNQAQVYAGQLNKLAAEIKLITAQTAVQVKEIDRVTAVIDLTNAQTATELKKPDNVEAQTNHVNAQTDLTEAQTVTESKKPANVEAQTEHVEAQTANVEAQTVTEQKKPANVQAQTDHIIAQTGHVEAQTELTEAQTTTEEHKPANVDAQTSYINAQSVTESKKPANVEAQTAYLLAQAETEAQRIQLMIEQIKLLKEQVKTQTQQIETEKAKAKLYIRQIEGFDENFKEKMLKIMIDGFTVVYSVAKDAFSGALPEPVTVDGINAIYRAYMKREFDLPDTVSQAAGNEDGSPIPGLSHPSLG